MKASVIFLTLFLAFNSYAQGAAPDIVYVRIPRTTEPMEFVNSDGTITTYINVDLYDFMPEVTNRIDKFNGPSQIVIRRASGEEEIIYDCMDKIDPECVALDPMVSFDGKKVAFTVIRGSVGPYRKSGQDWPNMRMKTSFEAQIHIWDSEANEVTALPHTANTYDMSPVWLPNGRIMFVSTRSGKYGSYMRSGSPQKHNVFELWTSLPDGSNPRLVGNHETNAALHPYVLRDGRVIYSSWRLEGHFPFRHKNGANNGLGTVEHMFWLFAVHQDGGAFESIFGLHNSKNVEGSNSVTTKAIHFSGQRANGDICSTNYYRGTAFGAGSILCWPEQPFQVEGRSPYGLEETSYAFSPPGTYRLANWSDNGGTIAEVGRVVHPEGLPDNNMMMSVARGPCDFRFQSLLTVQSMSIGCDTGIYKTTTIPSQSLNDLEMIVDSPDWHEIMARTMTPYEDVYGIASPPVLESPKNEDGKCFMRSASLMQEIEHNRPYQPDRTKACPQQGCSVENVEPQIDKLRIWGQAQWDKSKYPNLGESTTVGHVQSYWGDVPFEEDGSSIFEVPCEKPFVMTAIDANGLEVAQDQFAQSLRPGEVRTCGGCHFHSGTGLPFDGKDASLVIEPTKVGFQEDPKVYEWNSDIVPILEEKCYECHSSFPAGGSLRLNVPGFDAGSSHWNVVWDYRKDFSRSQWIPRDHTSYYLGAFAKESLFYWKAVGERVDGRQDDTRDDDIDFGDDHSVDLSGEDKTTIRRWIDSGALYMASNIPVPTPTPTPTPDPTPTPTPEPTPEPGEEGVIDNTDESTSSVGTWIVSSVSGAYGGDSLYCNSNCSFTWSYEIPVSGYFQVAAIWTYHANRSDQVPYSVEHPGGPTIVVVDQSDQSLEKEFQSLGVFWFEAGEVDTVTVSPDNGQANADAVRFQQMEFCPVE